MRGYQKRVVYLKNIGSSVFEEAYFVIKTGANELEENKEVPDFINEANRIIEESVRPEKKRRGKIGFKETVFFITGFLISSIIYLILSF